MIYLNTVVEDILSESILEKIFATYNDKFYPTFIGHRGNTFIKENIVAFNKAAKQIPFFILTDLDKHECSPTLISEWFNNTPLSSRMMFRIAEKEVEAWLLADRQAFSKYFNVPIAKLPLNPDQIDDPKLKLIHLVRSHSKKEIRDDILSKFNENKQGPGYNDRLIIFVQQKWNISRAAQNSLSLRKALMKLHNYN